MSPSVVGTVITKGQRVQFVVLFQGAPGWFGGSSGNTVQYSGSSDIVIADLTYGGVPLRFTYDVSQRTATVLGQSIKLNGGENTILVRDVKNTSGARDRRRRDGGSFGRRAATDVADLFRRSPEVVAFLRYDVGTPNELVNAVVRRFVCDLL
jgi:hypothetical protein